MTLARFVSAPVARSRGSARASTAGEVVHRWDRLGVWASAACAVHCLAAPLLFLAAPAFAGICAHPLSHALFALLVLPLAGTVLLRGYRVHRRPWVAAAAVLGSGCILTGSLLPFLGIGAVAPEAGTCVECCPRLVPDGAEVTTLSWPLVSVVTILGSSLLTACHLGNLACCRRCGPGSSA